MNLKGSKAQKTPLQDKAWLMSKTPPPNEAGHQISIKINFLKAALY